MLGVVSAPNIRMIIIMPEMAMLVGLCCAMLNLWGGGRELCDFGK